MRISPALGLVFLLGAISTGVWSPSDARVVVTPATPISAATTDAMEAFTSTVTVCINGTCAPYNVSTGPVVTQMTVTPMSVPPPGDGYAPVNCNYAYTWTDTEGTFGYQHACGGTTSQWYYSVSAALVKTADGNAHESGMQSTVNGVKRGMQAPHTEPITYKFHGSFNPIKKGDGLVYSDTITFPCNLGSGCTETIAINGALRQVS